MTARTRKLQCKLEPTSLSALRGAILGGDIAPYKWNATSDVLRRLRFQQGPGIDGRPVFPGWSHFCAVWIRAHMEHAIITGGHRQMHCAPNMDRLPKPMWRPGAPIGFAAAIRWMQARNLDKEITLAPGSHGACSSTDIIVPKPAGTCNGRLRIRGKQPAAVAMAQQVPVITMPSMATPRPRATYDKPKTGLDDLTPEEETEVAQLSGIKRNQALKRMGHNKNAEESGKHYILEAVDGSLKCRDCDMAGRWSE